MRCVHEYSFFFFRESVSLNSKILPLVRKQMSTPRFVHWGIADDTLRVFWRFFVCHAMESTGFWTGMPLIRSDMCPFFFFFANRSHLNNKALPVRSEANAKAAPPFRMLKDRWHLGSSGVFSGLTNPCWLIRAGWIFLEAPRPKIGADQ